MGFVISQGDDADNAEKICQEAIDSIEISIL